MNIKNDKGFSYVELILVLAIMALMVAMIGLSYGLVTRNNVSKAAAKMESVFNTARITSLSKGSEAGALNLMQENGTVYYYIGKYAPDDVTVPAPEWNKLTQYPVYITTVRNTTHSDLSDGVVVTYKYNPSSGNFKECPYEEFIFSNGKKDSILQLYKSTGKCKVIQ